MKKWILVLGLISNFKAFAYDYSDCFETSGCLPCPNSTDGKCFYSTQGNKMTIYGPTSTEKNEDGSLKEVTWIPNDAFYNGTTSSLPEGITSLEMVGNIVSIGSRAFEQSPLNNVQFSETLEIIGKLAFWNNSLAEINFPNTLKSIEDDAFNWNGFSEMELPSSLNSLGDAFRGVQLTNIIIPDSISEVKDHTFSQNYSLQTFVVGENTTLGDIFTYTDGIASIQFKNFKMFCGEGNASCVTSLQSAGATEEQIAQILKTFTKDNTTGVYKTSDGKYYADIHLMAKNIACDNKQNCELAAANIRAGYPFDIKGKSYVSVGDLIKGNYIKKRIYTIDEANAVTGNKNRVSIKYR